MANDKEYVKMIFGIQYKWKVVAITTPRSKAKLENKALRRI